MFGAAGQGRLQGCGTLRLCPTLTERRIKYPPLLPIFPSELTPAHEGGWGGGGEKVPVGPGTLRPTPLKILHPPLLEQQGWAGGQNNATLAHMLPLVN